MLTQHPSRHHNQSYESSLGWCRATGAWRDRNKTYPTYPLNFTFKSLMTFSTRLHSLAAPVRALNDISKQPILWFFGGRRHTKTLYAVTSEVLIKHYHATFLHCNSKGKNERSFYYCFENRFSNTGAVCCCFQKHSGNFIWPKQFCYNQIEDTKRLCTY